MTIKLLTGTAVLMLSGIICLAQNKNDWANLGKYGEDNIRIGLPAPGEIRVVFMGNSITEGWINIMPEFFKDKPYIDRGISGQTTPQMLIRFKPDVVALKPTVVVILAGINDIAGNTGPSSQKMIEDNISSMVEIAQANGIRVVLSSVLPAYDFPWNQGTKPADKVVALNEWIKKYAAEKGCVYLDYFTPMADERNGLKAELTYDGVHPNLAGYQLMAPLAEKAIAHAMTKAPQPIYPVPTEKQIAWHEMEMNAFVHFTINTFTDLEWGMGSESESLFNPSNANPGQWIDILSSTGFRGVILTCKHHDGFCLWPSIHTDHSIRNSPYKNGHGDLVKEVSEACRNKGLKFGVYLSPWDRNQASYGKPAYIDYYRNQLRELFNSYGPVFEMWFDGANGGTGYYGGANEKRSINGKSYYDWPRTLNLVRSLQSDVLFFSDAGPDIRWVGNEEGNAGITNWNMITPDTLYAGKPGINDLLNSGSENGTAWIPAETDVSIRPGWFWHEKENDKVKSAEELFEIYLSSVGRGSLLLLNIPPDKRGLIHENDRKSLEGFRELLHKELGNDLAAGAMVKTSNVRGNDPSFDASNLTDGKKETYWATEDNVNSGSIQIDLGNEKMIHYIMLQEYIRLGQRVKQFSIEILQDDLWKTVASGTTVGYKRILRIDPAKTRNVRINITDSRACPVISNVSIF